MVAMQLGVPQWGRMLCRCGSAVVPAEHSPGMVPRPCTPVTSASHSQLLPACNALPRAGPPSLASRLAQLARFAAELGSDGLLLPVGSPALSLLAHATADWSPATLRGLIAALARTAREAGVDGPDVAWLADVLPRHLVALSQPSQQDRDAIRAFAEWVHTDEVPVN